MGIYIPKIVAENVGIHIGTRLQMTYNKNKIEFTTGPSDTERLDAYLARVLLDNKLFITSTDSMPEDGILDL